MSSPKRRIETDVSTSDTKAHIRGGKVDVLITYLMLAIGDEVSGVCLGSPPSILTLLQDVRRSYPRRQDNHPMWKRYLEDREADVGRPRLMSDYEVTLVNDNSEYRLGLGLQVSDHYGLG